ncbi:hypothetical protein PAESOLCIP111_01116 [Paenibacillus solanacearum]|uniref:DUF4965 domain-containing protein n=1 Tax=Paenibacillus solanacearum TaxID=2048548 RepID=A0A916JVW5_9BACL|nr:glutaminase family protein [Paenibacillus solanacearum]CAG7608957.1 hypothetical protein PAESOLCIP111_01116 [Paenibacillus solanacearum]
MNRTLRPPAVPLVTVDPYFSVWSASDRLYESHTCHWTGKRHAMTGMAVIDDTVYRFMGRVHLSGPDPYEPPHMEQTGLRVLPLSSIYTFEAGGVRLEVDFTTPLLPGELDVLSRPASYITVRANSIDERLHSVRIYFDATAEWCVDTPDQQVEWGRLTIDGHPAMKVGTTAQPVLVKDGDNVRIDWGYLYVVAPRTDYSGEAAVAIGSLRTREAFAAEGRLPEADDERMPRAVEDDTPLLAVLLDIGDVGAEAKSAFVVLGYDDIMSIEYFHKPLPAYWRHIFATMEEMLAAAIRDYPLAMQKCELFNRELLEEAAAAGGPYYADLLAIAYRQAIAAHKLVRDENGDVLFLSKECFSNGCIGTVDVSYPSAPLFLRYNPELVKGMLRPIMRFARSEAWPYEFAPHDVGRYPKANGQVYRQNKREEQMPVEECGNMLIMAAAVCAAEQSDAFAQEHWDLLTLWAEYLAGHGLDPENQNCTDDFASHLAHNANLSIKAIMAIGGYGILCRMRGLGQEASHYYDMAKRMAKEWQRMALDASGGHYKLTFDRDGTWGMKYNLVWDDIFQLELFPQEVKQKELAHYLAIRNEYGTPLDSRNTFTKSDWLVWVASFAKEKRQFEEMIEPLWRFLHESPHRVPAGDWYDTIEPLNKRFQHRSVVGGFFVRLLLFPKRL